MDDWRRALEEEAALFHIVMRGIEVGLDASVVLALLDAAPTLDP